MNIENGNQISEIILTSINSSQPFHHFPYLQSALLFFVKYRTAPGLSPGAFLCPCFSLNYRRGGMIMKMPENIVPMKASTGKEPFSDIHYSFEIALQGIRTIAYVQDGSVKLQDAKLKDITGKYPEIVAGLLKIKENAIIDGEIVSINDSGV